MLRTAVVLVAALLVGCPGERPPPPPAPRAAPPASTTTPLPPPRDDGRLPALAAPLRYELRFEVDPDKPRFRGQTRIVTRVPAATSHVVLHANGLAIASAKARLGSSDSDVLTGQVKTRAAHGTENPEELVLTFPRPLPAGEVTLEIAYDAPFGEELSGLYRLREDGRGYAFTQFEATDARRAFPCFDEPGFKTPFRITVDVPEKLLVFANTPEVARREEAPGTVSFEFAETKPLPTYLVALAVGEFDVREAKRDKDPPLRLVTAKGKAHLGELALEATGALVDRLGEWFGIPYPYEKLDIVAVPDFAAGAMENAGLITFREELLLLDPARASVRARRAQALVVAHELAHQWFGNLVTAAWWDDLWLNEGMATWMEWRIVDRWRPTFGARADAVASAHGIMDLDGLGSARAVRQPVRSTGEAREAFDGITYEKGAAVLSTIESWIGEEAFQRGVRQYLTENAHKSADATKLLDALEQASGKEVEAMAATFLDRPGVPEVAAQLTCGRGGRWHVELTQAPWRPLGTLAPEASDQVWTIPVCVRAQGDKKDTCADLAHGAPALVAGRGRCPSYVHPNAQSGYYRFSLPEKSMVKLASARADLDVPARLSTLSNAWAQVRAGTLPAAALLKIMPSFDGDRSRHVVDQIVGILYGMSDTLVEDIARPAFQKFVTARLARRKKDLGWVPKRGDVVGDEAMMRRSVLLAMGDLAEDEVTLREADEHASKWLADPSSVDSDSAAVALDLASRHAGPARLEQLREAARKAKTREDRITALRAMSGFDDPEVLKSALSATLTGEIHAHDMRYVLGAVLARRKARNVAEAWIRANWQELRRKLPGALGRGLVAAAGVACTKEEVDERTAFYTPRAAEIGGANRRLAEALEGGAMCSALREHGSRPLTRGLVPTP
jgi:cytosol alanyl aminopeptidase